MTFGARVMGPATFKRKKLFAVPQNVPKI